MFYISDSTYPRFWHRSVEQSLASCWSEFVNCPKRLQTEGPFLDNFLKSYRQPYVLDSAMGIGCEAIYIAKKGYQIIGNEISSSLREIAINSTKMANVNFKITAYDWRDLAVKLGVGIFDLVLLLGNSLCLLREYRERFETVKNLRRVCKDGGTVIADERNFRYILENRSEILKGNFRYSGNVIYCGETIKGFPVLIQNDCVRFVYVDIKNNDNWGYLDMHPFSSGEMVDLFFKAGFEHVDLYSDLKPGYNENADFYTYASR